MIPWREQFRIVWNAARWVIWPPDMPLWGQLTYKIAQVVAAIGIVVWSGWVVAAGGLLSLATAMASYWRKADGRGR
jgi:hypothetical protein